MSIDLTDYQIKAAILHTITSESSPIPKVTVFDILGICGINSFALSEALEQMIEDKYILQYKLEDGAIFIKFSEKGKQLSKIMKSDIPIALRQKITAVTATEIAKLKADLDINYVIDNAAEGFFITISLQDDGFTLLQLKMYAPTKLQAKMMVQTFKKNPLTIYKNILSIFFDVQ